jgi:hypothetical protein
MRSTCRGVRPLLLALSLLPLGAAGCGASRYPVQGKVTFEDGTPLTSGLVVFEKNEGETKVMARGEIGSDGSYRLGTSSPGDGAAPGKYRVLVTVPEPIDAEQAKRTPDVDKRFMDFNTSGLECEVKAASNEYPIKVTRALKGRK